MSFLIYGAGGYSGGLIAREAVARGHRPTLAGRRAEPVEQVARELDLPWSSFPLEDGDRLAAAIEPFPAVLHCAGPFIGTFAPMVAACLRTGTHYLDITGEIAVFEALARKHTEAREAAIVIMPGTGFDVVPTDCLAAHLARRRPDAVALTLAFEARGGISRGTALTAVGSLGEPGAVREDGRITAVPAAWKTREVDFGEGPRLAVTIPWGDVSTAWHSTRIPNIEVYLSRPPSAIRSMQRARWLGPLLRAAPLRALLGAVIRRRIRGPSDADRSQGGTVVYGEVRSASGAMARARLRGPEGYTFTALTAVRIMEAILDGRVAAGFQTPSLALGPDFVLEIPGVTREDLD